MPMDPETKKHFEELDEWMRQTDKKLMTSANLIRVGIPMLVDTQTKIDALVDSDMRLYGSLSKLMDHIDHLVDSDTRLYVSLSKLTDHIDRLTGNVDRLAEMQKETDRKLQAYFDSLTKGANGHG